MAAAFPSKHRAIASACMATVQLAGAVIAGVSFVRGDVVLFSASAAFTAVVMLVNRWCFQGWRESFQARRGKSHTPVFSR